MNYRIKQITLLFVVFGFLSACSKSYYSSISTSKTSKEISVAQPDTIIENIISPYKQQLDVKMNKVIGIAEKELKKEEYQSPLANLINDIVLKKSIDYYGKPIDFALVTNGGLRTPIPQGAITVGNIFELMPFENELVVLELKGSTVLKLLFYAASKGNAPMAGLKYDVFINQPRNVFINNIKLDTSTTYTMVVSDYLADGGDGLEMLKENTKYIKLGKMYRDAILEGIEERTANNLTIDADLDDRVKFMK